MAVRGTHGRNSHGAIMVEMAVSMAVLLMLLAGIWDYSRALTEHAAMLDAAHAAGIVGTLTPRAASEDAEDNLSNMVIAVARFSLDSAGYDSHEYTLSVRASALPFVMAGQDRAGVITISRQVRGAFSIFSRLFLKSCVVAQFRSAYGISPSASGPDSEC